MKSFTGCAQNYAKTFGYEEKEHEQAVVSAS
jgi:hypothetical protein